MMPELTSGWEATELAEDRARRALEKWYERPDISNSMAMAETLRQLLAELGRIMVEVDPDA